MNVEPFYLRNTEDSLECVMKCLYKVETLSLNLESSLKLVSLTKFVVQSWSDIQKKTTQKPIKLWAPYSHICFQNHGRHLKVFQSSSLGLPSYQATACFTAPTLFLGLVQHELNVCTSAVQHELNGSERARERETEASCHTQQRKAHQQMLIMLNKNP